MNAIVVVDEKWQIGKDGDLLVHLPGDLKYFKERTLGKKIVIGRKTLESFPGKKPLPGRENLVLTGDPDYEAPGCRVFHSKEELMEWLRKAACSMDTEPEQTAQPAETAARKADAAKAPDAAFSEAPFSDVYICGGESIYRQFLEACDTFFVTKIYETFDGDKAFPNLDVREDLEVTWQSPRQEEKGIAYQFFVYKRKREV